MKHILLKIKYYQKYLEYDYNRFVLGKQLVDEIRLRLDGYYIIIEQISITDFEFSEEFNKAIELKVTAQQEALEALNRLEKVKYEAEQTVVKAKAEANVTILDAQARAEATRLINNALIESPDYLTYYSLQKWDGHMPQTLFIGMSNNTNPLFAPLISNIKN